MLKDELKNIPNQPKPIRKNVSVALTEQMYKEFELAARELDCTISEYIRRLHNFAKQDD